MQKSSTADKYVWQFIKKNFSSLTHIYYKQGTGKSITVNITLNWYFNDVCLVCLISKLEVVFDSTFEMIPLKFLCPKWQADKWLKHEAISLFFDFTKVFKWSHFWFGICFSVIFQTSSRDQSVWEVVQSCSVKKEFLHLSLNPQENTCARVSFLIKLQAWVLQLY